MFMLKKKKSSPETTEEFEREGAKCSQQEPHLPTAGTHSPASEETAELLRVLAGCHRRGPNPRNPRKTPATKGLRTFFSPVIDVPGKTWAASL